MDLRKCIAFKVLRKINQIGEMKSFMKPNFSLCMEELLMILKNNCDKRVTVMNRHLEMYRACWHKTTFNKFLLSTDNPVIG